MIACTKIGYANKNQTQICVMQSVPSGLVLQGCVGHAANVLWS